MIQKNLQHKNVFLRDQIEGKSNKEINEFLHKEFFKSDYLIGKIVGIDPDSSKAYPHFCFVELCVPEKVNERYYIDNEKSVWTIYGNLRTKPEIATKIKKDDVQYLYFKYKKKNYENSNGPDSIIEMEPRSIEILYDHSTFLSKYGFSKRKVKLPGEVIYNEEERYFLASSTFYEEFEELHKGLVNKINDSKEEVDRLEKDFKELKKEMDIYKKEKVQELEDKEAKIVRLLQKREEEVTKREEKVTEREENNRRLINILGSFGFSAFKEDSSKILVSNKPILKGNTYEQFKYIQRYLYQKSPKPLIYHESILRRFYAALQTNQLIVLSGSSGTGKTSLVNAFAHAIDGVAKVISVKPNWIDNQDLLGFYNPLERLYYSTPFLDAIVEAKRNKDKLFLICLDEMNLAHVEYYFAELLSKLELEEPYIELYSPEIYEEIKQEVADTIYSFEEKQLEPTIEHIRHWINEESDRFSSKFPGEFHRIKKQVKLLEQYPANFEIPANVRFIGTMNVDETTKQLSPKVVDRSFIIEVFRYDNITDDELKELKKEKVEAHHIPASQFSPKNLENIKLTDAQIKVKEELENVNRLFLKPMSIEFNDRVIKHIELYLTAIRSWGKPTIQLDLKSDLIQSKLLPRFVFSFREVNDFRYQEFNKLIDFWKDIREHNERIDIKLEQMLDIADKYKVVNFWGGY